MATNSTVTGTSVTPELETIRRKRAELDEAERLITERDRINGRLGQLGLMVVDNPVQGQASTAMAKITNGKPKANGNKRGKRHTGPTLGSMVEQVLAKSNGYMRVADIADAVKPNYTGHTKDLYTVILNTLRADKHRFHHRRVDGKKNRFEWGLKAKADAKPAPAHAG